MNKIFAIFLLKLTFQRQLGITVAFGIFMLALFSSIVGSWQGNERVRGNLLEQGRHITESLARQSSLALIYAAADNAVEAASSTLDFPGVVGVEIRDDTQRVLLMRGNISSAEFPAQVFRIAGTDNAGGTQAAAVLDAESQNAWRFVAPVYSQPASSPFHEAALPELLGHVTVVMSKAPLTQMATGIFVANLTTSFSFALLFLFLIRLLANRLTQPLNQLSDCMGRAEAGELQVRAVLAGPQDIADMAHAFNSMMSVLEARAAEIRQLNTGLERRVIERTAQLEAANKELESFSYSISHDLKVPLRAVDGFSRILMEEYRDKLDAEGLRQLNVVRDNTKRMAQLIDDMLAYLRSGREKLSRGEVNMEDLVRDVMGEITSAAAGREVKLEIKPLPPAHADRVMMRQVLVNLLGNAIKFTRPKAVAQIEVGAMSGENEVVYYVRDNGVGFDMQYAGKLFGEFQHLHGIGEFEGTGIGLAIVKRIVARHGGRVWADGKVNAGATVYFAMPTEEKNHG